MVVVGLAYIFYWNIRRSIPWVYFAWGGMAWVVGVGVKAAVAGVANPPVISGLRELLGRPLADPPTWLYIGLLTGVFETAAALLFVAKTRLRQAGWAEAVAFGIGFGSLEALLLGLGSFTGVALALMAPELLPKEALAAFRLPPGNPWLWLPAGTVERLFTVMVHILANVLIIYAWRSRRWRYLWASFAYKIGVDGLAAFGIVSLGVASLSRVWALEAGILVFAVVGLWGTLALRSRFQELGEG
jgi:uncharacterized membrane protein YhfC